MARLTACGSSSPSFSSWRVASRRCQYVAPSILPCTMSIKKSSMSWPSLVFSRTISAMGLGPVLVWESHICSTVAREGGWGQRGVGGKGGWGAGGRGDRQLRGVAAFERARCGTGRGTRHPEPTRQTTPLPTLVRDIIHIPDPLSPANPNEIPTTANALQDVISIFSNDG